MSDATSNIDGRRALGRRPGAAPPPRIYIDDGPLEDVPPSPVSMSRIQSTLQNVSLALPSSQTSDTTPSPTFSSARTTAEPSRRFRRPTISRPKLPKPQTKGLYETQKLLSHLLDRLESRDSAPDLLDRAAIAARHGASQGKGKAISYNHIRQAIGLSGRHHDVQGQGMSGIGSEDFDDRLVLEEGQWDTEAVYDLVEQLKGLLILADKQGLDVFGTSSTPGGPSSPTPLKSKIKGRLASFSPNPLASSIDEPSSSSPISGVSTSGPELLVRALKVLRSLINADCLHRTLHFRPLCPPNALQSACLDLATYLYHHGGFKVQIETVEMIIEGVYGMGQGMSERLCEWIERRLGELLSRLAKERGDSRGQISDWNNPFSHSKPKDPSQTPVPTFAISTESNSLDPLAQSAQAQGWVRYSPTTPTFPFFRFPDEISGILSTHAASRDASDTSLLVASLTTRLLTAITSTIDLHSSSLTTIYRVHRLLSLVLTSKPDSALDLLEIVALAPLKSRITALELLTTFYPAIMGHNTITRRPALSTYTAQRTKWETGQDRVFGEDDTENHHYVPWRCGVGVSEDEQTVCTECVGSLKGFCIKCTLCDDYRHLQCYQPHEDAFVYEVIILSAKSTTPHSILVKFSKCLPSLEEQVVGDAAWQFAPSRRRIHQHDLHLVNLFNLALCGLCREPLWGTAAQAYACQGGCQRLYHPRCVDLLGKSSVCKRSKEVLIDEISAQKPDPFTISKASLQTSFDRDVQPLILPPDMASARSYDEIAVLHGALWTQFQIYKNGLASGSVRIKAETQGFNPDFLPFRPGLKSYDELLTKLEPTASSAVTDYAHVSEAETPLAQGYLFSRQYLTYCTALLRAPTAPSRETTLPSDGLLKAGNLQAPFDGSLDPIRGSYETLSLATVGRGLAADLNISDTYISSLFLNQIRILGLCSVSAGGISPEKMNNDDIWCAFVIPLLMDSSSTVEILILSIEVLLSDLDLSQAEQGLRLLVNRAWPSLLCSPYALERLGNAVVSWIIAEDDDLHDVVKLYASQRKRLPGVRIGQGSNRTTGSSSVAAYKDSRYRLLAKFGRPWLKALHDQDPALYAHILYEQCKVPGRDDLRHDLEVEVKGNASKVASLALERMTSLADADVVFSTSLDLLTAWLEDLGSLAGLDMSFKSLPRFLRQSSAPKMPSQTSPDVWSLAASTTSRDSAEGVEHVCRWMRVLSFSGVEVPWDLLGDLAKHQTISSSNEALMDLVIAVGANITDIDAGAFAQLCSALLEKVTLSFGLERALQSSLDQQDPLLLRRTMLLVLRAHGVSSEDLANSKFEVWSGSAPQAASASRKRRMTGSRVQIKLESSMVMTVVNLLRGAGQPVEDVLDFLWLLTTKASLAADVEGLLYTNAQAFYEILWPLYDQHLDRRCRARMFLRVLAINSLPLEDLISSQSASSNNPRVEERLLTFILELSDDAVTFESSSWRSPAVGIINLFFDALMDPRQTIPDNLVIKECLVPTQLSAITRCYEVYLVESSDEKRLALLTKLHRLRSLFPSWPILSWKVIEDIVVEQSTTIAQLRSAETMQARSAVSDAQALRSSLLALGLGMLSTGTSITWIEAQRFQQHVASVCSLPWAESSDKLIDLFLPALRDVLDSTVRIPIGAQPGDTRATKKTTLIGALFVPVVIDLGSELYRLDFLAQRCLLDILMVTFFKQNTRPVELAALGALQTLADFANTQVCTENRLLASSILQTALDRVERDSLIRIIPILFSITAKTLVHEFRDGGEAAVLEQTKILLFSMIKQYGKSGLYLQLLKNDGLPDRESESALGPALKILQAERATPEDGEQSLLDAVFGDLPDILKRGRQTLAQVLVALERYVEVLDTVLTDDTAEVFGLFINRLGKHVADWDFTEFDPNPILKASVTVMELLSTGASITLLHQIATLLHLSLSRFDVYLDTASVVAATSERVATKGSSENTVRTVLFELSGSAINGLQVTMMTLQTLLTYLASEAVDGSTSRSESIAQRSQLLAEACPGCMTILLRAHPAFHHEGNNKAAEHTMGVLKAAAQVMVAAECLLPGSLTRALSITSEAASTQLSVFSYILLSAIDHCTELGRQRILTLYPIIARAISLGIRGAADLLSVEDPSGTGIQQLSAMFVVFRLAILLAERIEVATVSGCLDSNPQFQEDILDVFWRRVWPDLSRIVIVSLDDNCLNTPLRAVTHSVFLDSVIFLSSVQSKVLPKHLAAISSLLKKVGYSNPHSGSGNSKYQKATMAVESLGSPSGTIDKKVLLASLQGDLLATERLRALRSGP